MSFLKTVILIISLLIFTTTIGRAQCPSGYNPNLDPSIYYGKGQYRPYSYEFEQDMIAGMSKHAYRHAYENKYPFKQGANRNTYDNRGLPRVVWVAP